MSNFKYKFALLCTIFSLTYSMNLQNDLLNAINNLDCKKATGLLQQNLSSLTAQERQTLFNAIDNHPCLDGDDHDMQGPLYLFAPSAILWFIFYMSKEQKVPRILNQKDNKDFDVFVSYLAHYSERGMNGFKKGGKYVFGALAIITGLYLAKEFIAGGYTYYLENKHKSIDNLFSTTFPGRQ